KSVQIGGVDLELAHVSSDVFIKLLADLYQFVLQVPYLVPGWVIAVDAGAMIVAQSGPQIIGAGGIEPGAIERRDHVVHLLVQGDVGEHAADFLFTNLSGIPERLRGMHLLGQGRAISGVYGDE